MKLLSLLALLASCLPSLAQVWGNFSDMTYMGQGTAAAAAGTPALPQPGNITMYWDSELAPEGKQIAWTDSTNGISMVAVNSNTTTSGYMVGTPDGMIMSSGVMANSGAARIFPSGKSLGTNWSVWATFKREDLQTTRKMLFVSGNDLFTYLNWVNLWNLSTPMEVTPSTNVPIGQWSDALVTQTNNATYSVYLDGQFRTNQPRSTAATLQDFAFPYHIWPNMEKIGQIVVWTNTILTAADALTLHQRMTNQMPNLATVSNALPSSLTGLRNAWRTAGYVGRWPTLTWTDYVSGKTFTSGNDWNDPSLHEYAITASGRGMRNWSAESGVTPRTAWLSGTMQFPSDFTMFLTFTPSGVGDTTAYLMYTGFGNEMVWYQADSRVRTLSAWITPALTINQPHTIMLVSTGNASNYTAFCDGQWVTNKAGGYNLNDTFSKFGSLVGVSLNGQFGGHLGEFLLYTNTTFSTNEAVAYHTYATNQYGFDWYGGTNAYGYYFTTATTSNLWTSPILQQQTNTGSAHGIYQNVGHQKIKNTSSINVKIKNIRFRVGEGAGSSVNVFAYVLIRPYSAIPIPDLGGYSSTNTLTSFQATAWRDFVFANADVPTIPANTDFWIVMQATGAGQGNMDYATGTGGTNYQNTAYSKNGSTSYNAANDFDFAFEIYTCP